MERRKNHSESSPSNPSNFLQFVPGRSRPLTKSTMPIAQLLREVTWVDLEQGVATDWSRRDNLTGKASLWGWFVSDGVILHNHNDTIFRSIQVCKCIEETGGECYSYGGVDCWGSKQGFQVEKAGIKSGSALLGPLGSHFSFLLYSGGPASVQPTHCPI